jgi:hypothetical protein
MNPLRASALFSLVAAGGLAAGCGDRSLFDPSAATAVVSGAVCGGFVMPNPARARLPNPSSYTENDDGTVVDNVTGLTWERVIGSDALTNPGSAARCEGKGAGWRLPTRLELLSLVDYTIAAPGPTISPIFTHTPDAVFWTSSNYAGDPGDAWTIGFDAGYSDYAVRDSTSLSRCVRPSVRACQPQRYETRAGGLVFDRATGLIWQRTPALAERTWADALASCAAVGPGWRAPSLTELQTIIDDTKEYPAVDPDAFPDTPSVVFWTSTPSAESPSSVWVVDFFYGASDRDVPGRLYRVRCVR